MTQSDAVAAELLTVPPDPLGGMGVCARLWKSVVRRQFQQALTAIQQGGTQHGTRAAVVMRDTVRGGPDLRRGPSEFANLEFGATCARDAACSRTR